MAENLIDQEIQSEFISVTRITDKKIKIRFKLTDDSWLEFEDYIIRNEFMINLLKKLGFSITREIEFRLEKGLEIYKLINFV